MPKPTPVVMISSTGRADLPGRGGGRSRFSGASVEEVKQDPLPIREQKRCCRLHLIRNHERCAVVLLDQLVGLVGMVARKALRLRIVSQPRD